MIFKEKFNSAYIRSFVFGVEDSLVSTAGLLSGVAIADVPRSTIILTGLVLIFVEAFSMGVGSFLSEHSAEEYEQQGDTLSRHSIKSALIMFGSYFVSGFIPLLPYALLGAGTAFGVSVALSLTALFLLGVIRAKISNLQLVKHGLQMLVIGGIAILLGVAVGKFISGYGVIN